jgi:hypothetical protein
VCRVTTHDEAARRCVQRLTFARILFRGFLLGEQGQQRLVPTLVARRIALAFLKQPPIMLDVCIVNETLHGKPPSRARQSFAS